MLIVHIKSYVDHLLAKSIMQNYRKCKWYIIEYINPRFIVISRISKIRRHVLVFNVSFIEYSPISLALKHPRTPDLALCFMNECVLHCIVCVSHVLLTWAGGACWGRGGPSASTHQQSLLVFGQSLLGQVALPLDLHLQGFWDIGHDPVDGSQHEENHMLRDVQRERETFKSLVRLKQFDIL